VFQKKSLLILKKKTNTDKIDDKHKQFGSWNEATKTKRPCGVASQSRSDGKAIIPLGSFLALQPPWNLDRETRIGDPANLPGDSGSRHGTDMCLLASRAHPPAHHHLPLAQG
jgi:hypothetical protein